MLSRVRAAHAKPTPAPSLNDVVARAKSAAENNQWSKGETELWDVSSGGLSGTQTVVRRGHDFAAVVRLGPFTTARGRAGSRDWHQDENGVTIIDRTTAPERGTARSLERVSDPIDGYAVLETFGNGRIRRSYYDPKTYMLERRERWAGGHFSYTAWDDFRADASGRLQAWHYHGDDDDGNAFDYRMRSDRSTAIEDAAITIPRNRHSVVDFPPSTRVARLPAHFDHHRIHVRVGIRGHTFDFLVDSGASGIVISNAAARRLGRIYGFQNATAAGSFTSGRVIMPMVEVGALRMRDVVMHTAPIGERGLGDAGVAGLLGFDFLAGLTLRIDYDHETVDAYEPGVLPTPSSATSLEIGLSEQIPAATAQVGEASSDEFLVDTGAATSLLVFSRFARAHPADVSDDGVGAALAQTGIGLSAYGVGGRIATRPVRVKRVRVAGATFEDPLVYVADSPRVLGLDAVDGVVGADILARLGVIVLDYPNSRILIER